MPPVSPPSTDLRREVESHLAARRSRTLELLGGLTDRDAHEQFFALLSPIVWDVGHVGNFEELWLLRELDGRAPHDERLDHAYNAFENPRWVRGELEILDRAAAIPYLADVRAEVVGLLARLELDPDVPLLADGYVYRMIAQHEAQHQETILQALDLRDDLAAYALLSPSAAGITRIGTATPVDDTATVVIDGGPIAIGTTDRRWAYDNERPAHSVDLPGFRIDRHPATNRRYAAFVAAGGYDQPEHWSEAGWAWRQETGHTAPQGWESASEGWRVRRFGVRIALDPMEPVQHVCFWEAEAFARWSGGRLPTEFEWEAAAAWDPATGVHRTYPWGETLPTPARANVGMVRFGPSPVGSHPQGAAASGVEDLCSDVYEWTSSGFEPYPGFTAFPYPEYSEVFFGEDYRVLRGASWAIAGSLARTTYRNWDNPARRQIFAGVRVAYDGVR